MPLATVERLEDADIVVVAMIDGERVTQGLRMPLAGTPCETVRERLFVYYRDTSPLIGYYYAKGILHTVDGMGPIDEVTAAVARVIDALR